MKPYFATLLLLSPTGMHYTDSNIYTTLSSAIIETSLTDLQFCQITADTLLNVVKLYSRPDSSDCKHT